MDSEELALRKKEIRKDCFRKIDALRGGARTAASLSICATLKTLPEFQNARTVLAFTAMPSEPNLAGLFWGSEKAWGFSLVGSNDRIAFHRVGKPGELVQGSYGFREPNTEICPEINDSEIDLILVPGVGFDPETGARLGRGKGHYDRFLARMKHQATLPKAIGIAFSTQLCSLETGEHDIPMDAIITEHGRLKF